jgi:ribosomal protein S21
MVEFKRKKGESFESFLRRFNKRLQQSGNLYVARKAQHRQPSKSHNLRKRSALIGLEMRDQREYLRKVGKLKEDTRRRW